MKKTFIIALLAIFATGIATAESMKKECVQSLDSMFAKAFPSDAPGAAIAVIKNGKTMYERCYGYADATTKAPVTPTTNFCIASVSKQFSAVALLQLVEQGRLSLSDNLHKFFPQWKADFYDRITIHHILSHTSGIPDARPRNNADFVHFATDVESVGYMDTLSYLNFEPGDGHYEYINPTFQLAYQIVEKVTGTPFEQYMQKHVFNVAGMKHTCYFEAGRHIDNMAHGYQRANDGSWKEYDYGEESFFATKADGGIYTSIRDFAKWERALRDCKVLSPASRANAYSPKVSIPADAEYGYQPNTGYGYGFFIQRTPGRHSIVYHTGDNGGFTIYAGKVPDTDLVLLIFSTRPDIDRMGLVNDTYQQIANFHPAWILKNAK